MPQPQQFSFTGPYSAEYADIERRRKIAEMLQAQSMQPLQASPTPPGGFTVPISPFQGFAKIAQALAASKGMERATGEQKALGERYTRERGDAVSRALEAGQGRPAVPEQWMSEGEDERLQPEQAAVPPDRTKVYQALMGSQFPDLQTAGMTGMLKAQEPFNLREGEIRMGPSGQPIASNPKPAQPYSMSPGQTRFDSGGNQIASMPQAQQPYTLAPGQARFDSGGNQVASMPDRAANAWGEPYQMGGAWVQKNSVTGEVRQAVGREPRGPTVISPPAVTVTQIIDPANPSRMINVDARVYRGGSVGSPGVIGISGREGDAQKRENKRQFNMQGIGQTIQQAEDLLSGTERLDGGVTRQAPLPTGSGLGNVVDIAAGWVGASPSGSVQAQQLKAIGGALTAKMPRMEGPQSDRDTALYKEMAAELGNPSVPIARRKAALETVKQLWQKYERLNPDAFEDRRQTVTPASPKFLGFEP
ncbi:MAG: hypothetical protein NUV51_03925 [Sulfuricaulis sp.]|nr:hypothetical protein [Sulfuricaulis sp.]